MSDQLVVEREGLEKKDKTELQTIVSALGGNAPARLKKAELIDQILELSGATARSNESADASTPPEAPAENAAAANAPADSSKDEGEPKPQAKPEGEQRGQGAKVIDDAPAGANPLGPDGEPLADWEVQVLEEGGQLPAQRQGGGRGRGRQNKNDQNKNGQNGNDQAKSGQAKSDQAKSDQGRNGQNSNDQGKNDQKGEQQANNQKNGQGRGRNNQNKGDQNKNNQKGDQNSNNQKGGQNKNQDSGDDDPNRRSRRRRGRGRDRDDAGNEPISEELVKVEGYVDLRDEGYAFLRVDGFLPSRTDAYVSVKQVRQFKLRKGDHLTGMSRPANRNEKNPALQDVQMVNGVSASEIGERVDFEELTPIFPDERLVLEAKDEPLNMTNRIIDLLAPIGKGQRGLIVSPPKAGKTSIMKNIASAIETNNPEVEVLVLLIDERPEEVTDMTRHLKNGEVVASTFDRPPEEHAVIAELTLERAKRRAEAGKDVVLIVDGITRLARAYNMSTPQSGRALSGGIDAAALYPPKRFLGAARNFEEGGSLTILATALVETGSKMDEVIFEECKGTGNMELRLDRRLAEKRIFPAIDIDGSSTRNEELLRDRRTVEASWKLRRVIGALSEEGSSPAAGVEMLIERLTQFKTNSDFLDEIRKAR